MGYELGLHKTETPNGLAHLKIEFCPMSFESTDSMSAMANRMAENATAFLAALRIDQLEKAQMPFDDDVVRRDWHYIPKERTGLSLKEMEAHQRTKALALLDSGLSRRARSTARTIMSLEPILAKIEGPRRRFARDPELYYLSIFGQIEQGATWSWRFEGHHISVNYTIVNGSLVAPTPFFFGSNPALVRHGDRRGLRALKMEEDLARELLSSLDGEQKKIAIINAQAPDDILTRNQPQVGGQVSREGLRFKDMTAGQYELAKKLIDVYITRLPLLMAAWQRQKIESASLETAAFAWAGGINRGQGHYYRLLGSTFLAEYDCTQNQANHIHAVWRDLGNDFGLDFLKAHYQKSH